MRRYMGAAAIASAAVLLTAVTALASSNAVLSDTNPNPNGTNTPVGSHIAGSGQAKFTTTPSGSTGIFCNSSTITLTVGTNPTAPGTATLSLNGWTFSNCTINIAGFRAVRSITADNLSYTVSITSPPPDAVTVSPGFTGPIHFTFSLTNFIGQQVTCGYHVHDSSGDVFGTAGNGTNTLSFTNQQLDGDPVNNFQCPATLFLSFTFNLVDADNGNAPLYIN